MTNEQETTAHLPEEQTRPGDCTTREGEPRDCTTGEVWDELKARPTAADPGAAPDELRPGDQHAR